MLTYIIYNECSEMWRYDSMLAKVVARNMNFNKHQLRGPSCATQFSRLHLHMIMKIFNGQHCISWNDGLKPLESIGTSINQQNMPSRVTTGGSPRHSNKATCMRLNRRLVGFPIAKTQLQVLEPKALCQSTDVIRNEWFPQGVVHDADDPIKMPRKDP